jgi:Ser-tRNA(Ala) deacylase AlaX
MTKKVFWQDPYLAEHHTRAISVDDNEVKVESTIFYALSGGQESDHGEFNGIKVLAARHEGREIVYELPQDHGIKVGDPVIQQINWQRRYRLMRLHFAAEIILKLVYLKYPGIQKIGAHIGAEKARIDFAWAENISSSFAALTVSAEQIIKGDEMIESAFSDEAAGRRYWKIDAFSAVHCGGTHLKRTAEVGGITLKRKNIGKGKERIEIFVDDR